MISISGDSPKGLCEIGYHGPLCQSCVKTKELIYYKRNEYCVLCEGKSKEIPYFLGISAIYIIFLMIIIK